MSVYTSIGFYNLILDWVVERERLKTEEREKIVFSVGKNNSKSLKIISKIVLTAGDSERAFLTI